jgi:DNA-binding MarR family transcriptional regulator
MRAILDRTLTLAVLLNDDMTRDLQRRGLTRSRAHLVWELHHRGPSTQQTLAQALRVTPRAVTGLVDALVDSGFVTREPHPDDRRATLVTFTKRGQTTAKALERGHSEFARKLFGDLPDTTYRGFARGLDTVLGRLRELLDD